MVCLGLEPGAAGWKAQTNPLSYGSTPGTSTYFHLWLVFSDSNIRLQLAHPTWKYSIELSNKPESNILIGMNDIKWHKMQKIYKILFYYFHRTFIRARQNKWSKVETQISQVPNYSELKV